jgi:hypothetical protein
MPGRYHHGSHQGGDTVSKTQIARYSLGNIIFPTEKSAFIRAVLEKHGCAAKIRPASNPGESVIQNANSTPCVGGRTILSVFKEEKLLELELPASKESH